MQDIDGLGQIVPVIIAVLWVVAQVVRAVTGGKKAPQQRPRPVERPVAGNQEPQPGRDGEVLQQGAGREIRDFLDRLREEAGRAEAERTQEAPQPHTPAQKFDTPGHVAEAAPEESQPEVVDWEELDWEEVESAPVATEQPSLPPPLPVNARLAKRTEGPPATSVEPSSEESLFSVGSDSVGDDTSSWLPISDIVNTGSSERIRGVPIDEAMALREILAKPRASVRWRPGGFYDS